MVLTLKTCKTLNSVLGIMLVQYLFPLGIGRLSFISDPYFMAGIGSVRDLRIPIWQIGIVTTLCKIGRKWKEEISSDR